MKLCRCVLVLLFAVIMPLHAEMTAQKKDGAIYVQATTTDELEHLFNQQKFFEFDRLRGQYPRIFVAHLPTDWADVPENNAKQKMFIKILLPLVLKINEEIAEERAKIEQINVTFGKDKKISAEDQTFLEEMAKKYDVFTRMKDDSRTRILLRQLLVKADVVPPSLMISTAAIYTDWGMSRLALKANALYRDEIWYEDEGLKPQDDPNANYRYREFNSLEDCIRQRALKLNSHINYDYFRESRRVARTLKKPPYGPQLAATMINDSNLKNVAGLIDYTFTFFQLANTDYFSQLKDVE
ncbi:MAG: hypothetical protein MJ212_03220 [Alphaproteobacteria bacterium]|nr:hypothetical protein [Alphaproteobacteria bacterium]